MAKIVGMASRLDLDPWAKKQGMPFVAQKGNPWPLRCDDVAEMRAMLEAKGVQFFGDTLDTGVCHMAFFADPDGNALMLHNRYAPKGAKPS